MAELSTLKLIAAFVALLAMQGTSFAQTKMQHQSGMDHSKMMQQGGAKLPIASEPGQGGFAAIAEIVALLNADPKTDWSKVDISALREHLVDMNELTLYASATSSASDSSVIFTVSAEGRALKAVHNMVPAHAGVLSNTTSWNVKAEVTDTGAIMTVNSANPKDLQKISALGFFGVMATGAHHQAHHVLMAAGGANIHGN